MILRLCFSHLDEESRLDKSRNPCPSALSESSTLEAEDDRPSQRGDSEKLEIDLALFGAAATLASSSLAHTFTRQSGALGPETFPVTPVFELLSSQM
jgi:hypothetical protein